MKERCLDAKSICSATLHHFKLIFCGWSRKWHGGSASIRAQRDAKVLGAIYEINQACQRRLDKYEDYPSTYDRINLIVNTDIGEAISVFTYIKKQQAEETKPALKYLDTIKQGYKDWGIL